MKIECIIPSKPITADGNFELQKIKSSGDCNLTLNLNNLSSNNVVKIICDFKDKTPLLFKEYNSTNKLLLEKINHNYFENSSYQVYTYNTSLSVIYSNFKIHTFKIPVEIIKTSFNSKEGKILVKNAQFVDDLNDSIFLIADGDDSCKTFNIKLPETKYTDNVLNEYTLSSMISLSSKYIFDEEVNVLSNKRYYSEGFSLNHDSYLKNVADKKINYYSNLYLTDKNRLDDFINLKKLEFMIPTSFSTTIKDPVTLDSLTFEPEKKNGIFGNPNKDYFQDIDRIHEIIFIDKLRLKIKHKHRDYYIQNSSNIKYTNYYLIYDNVNSKFKYSNKESEATIFKYIIDKESGRLNLLVNDKIIYQKGQTTLSAADTNYKTKYYIINYYIQEADPRINSSWVSYDERYKNQYEIVPQKSRLNLENNYIFSTQYSNVTSNTIDINFLTLKNQHSHKNYSYRLDYMERNNYSVPVVDARRYYSLVTGNREEKGEYNFGSTYEFYNMDYKFDCDSYTKFYTSESLYPFEILNINDSLWHRSGSIAGENPYQSDKVFYRNTKVSGNEEYLCTWLYKLRSGRSIWLDRYYYPERTSYSDALASPMDSVYQDEVEKMFEEDLSTDSFYDSPYIFNSLEEESESIPQTLKSALFGVAFFDKVSDVIFEPNAEYIYFRIGNNYTKEIITTFSSSLIGDGLDLLYYDNTKVLYDNSLDEIEYVLENDKYAQIQKYTYINNSHELTISFWLRSDDWQKEKGYQLLGNYNTSGFSIFFDRKITPFIMVQHGKKVYIYNTDFDLINTVSLDNEKELSSSSFIRDIYRTDHLDFFETITSEKL